MTLYTIYRDLVGYPDSYVVRAWEVDVEGTTPHEGPVAVTHSLEKAREAVPDTARFHIERNDVDDKTVVESWL